MTTKLTFHLLSHFLLPTGHKNVASQNVEVSDVVQTYATDFEQLLMDLLPTFGRRFVFAR